MDAEWQNAVEGRDFAIAANVPRAAQGRPYERQPYDPVHRPLRICSLDPAISKLDGAIAEVLVPDEPLQPGPVGGVFKVDDFDADQGTHWGRVDLDDHSVLLRAGHAPSTTNPLFHQQMVYAVCSTVFPREKGTRYRLTVPSKQTWISLVRVGYNILAVGTESRPGRRSP